MKLIPILAALGLAAGCAGGRDRADATATSHFAAHEGRPAREKPAGKAVAAGDDGQTWWWGLIGGLLGFGGGDGDDDGS